jgi:2-keto-3-deoxy-L-fuconate dehydrogenase
MPPTSSGSSPSNLNVRSMFWTIQAFLPGMVEKGGGSIVNMSSAASSVKGAALRFIYGTTKAAVVGLTKSVAVDYVSKGIRCNAICPGTVQTPSLDERIAGLGAGPTPASFFLQRSRPAGSARPTRSQPWPSTWAATRQPSPLVP